MKNGENSVVDGKLTDEQLGKLYRKFREIEKRANEKVISFADAMEVLQRIIIENKSSDHLMVVNGLADIKTRNNNKGNYVVKEHKHLDKLIPELGKINLYLSEKQKNGSWINKDDLLKELSEKGVLNADALEYLLNHQELIPIEWRGRKVFFWGTTYKEVGRFSDGRTYVRYLEWNFEKWVDGYYDISCDMYHDNPAAVIYV